MITQTPNGPMNCLKIHHFDCTYFSFSDIEDIFTSPAPKTTVDILYGTKGTLKISHAATTDILHQGDMLVIPIREPYTVTPQTSNASFTRIRILPTVLYSMHQNVFEIKYILPFTSQSSPHQIYFEHTLLKNSPIPSAVKTINTECNTQKCCFEIAVKTQLFTIFLWIFRYWYDKGEMNENINDISRGALNKLDFVLEHIHENFDTHLEIEKLAYSVGFSYSYFTKIFKAGTGYKFTEYVNNLRLKHAEQMMLEKPDSPITYIAMECGFNSTSYFIQLFRKKKGITPNEFQKRRG